MKVELQNGDRITIPEGCRAQINGNEVVVEKEEESKDFKRGDILVSLSNEIILVDDYDFKGGHLYSFVHVDRCGQLSKEPYFQWNEWHDWRLATEEEKQLLFDKMKEQGLKWNAKEKRVEKIRWRAKKGEAYCRMGLGGEVFHEIDGRIEADNVFYDTLNYFHTEEQTKEAAKRVKETLRKYHEEIGE
ncbi:hypothetical protein [Segatella oris]|uniref:hypothetical protein n=1 Tax=Segatella oris TaxID=28135 RepID=UPI0028E7EDEA|nr:hypothetical protein [Segatella oris]